MSKEVNAQINFRRKTLQKAIMFEQNRQRMTGIHDPDLIANISEVESGWARRRASLIGRLHDDSN